MKIKIDPKGLAPILDGKAYARIDGAEEILQDVAVLFASEYRDFFADLTAGIDIDILDRSRIEIESHLRAQVSKIDGVIRVESIVTKLDVNRRLRVDIVIVTDFGIVEFAKSEIEAVSEMNIIFSSGGLAFGAGLFGA